MGVFSLHVFRPPLIKLGPAAHGARLWMYYGIETGITVLKNLDGTYTNVMSPTQDQIDDAVTAYVGGHEYEITDDEWAALQAAGYGDGTFTPPDVPVIPTDPGDGGGGGPTGPVSDPLAYGGGTFGSGRYGF